MKNFIYPALVALALFSACKKKDEPKPDLRDQFEGVWEGTITRTYPSILSSLNSADKDTWKITKTANKSNELTFTEVGSPPNLDWTGTMDGGTVNFSFTVIAVSNTKPVTMVVKGTALVLNKKMFPQGTTKITYDGKTYDGDWSGILEKK